MKTHEQAKAWRQKIGLDVQQLADLTGYSREAIYQFERGIRSDGEKQSEWAWQRYKLCCAAIGEQIGKGNTVEYHEKSGVWTFAKRGFEW